MSVNTQWIDVPNWDKFYDRPKEVKAGKRRMTWCKLHFDLLHKDSYLNLSPETRCLLHGIWMLFGSTHGEVPKSSRRLSQVLAQRVTKTQLELLNHAGFIEFTDTKPTPKWWQNGALEAEAEGDKEQEQALSRTDVSPRTEEPAVNAPFGMGLDFSLDRLRVVDDDVDVADHVASLVASLRTADVGTESALRRLRLPEGAYRSAQEAVEVLRKAGRAPRNDAGWVITRLREQTAEGVWASREGEAA